MQSIRRTLTNWHQALGHSGKTTLTRLSNLYDKKDFDISHHDLDWCAWCAKGKQIRKNIAKIDTAHGANTNELGTVLSFDIKGPLSQLGPKDEKYILVGILHGCNLGLLAIQNTKSNRECPKA